MKAIKKSEVRSCGTKCDETKIAETDSLRLQVRVIFKENNYISKHTKNMASNNVMNRLKRLTTEERLEIKEKFADVSSPFHLMFSAEQGGC